MSERKVYKLKHEAAEACNNRKHVMERFKTIECFAKKIYRSKCVLCKMYVDVIKKPLPNEINISGTAVSMNCTRSIECLGHIVS